MPSSAATIARIAMTRWSLLAADVALATLASVCAATAFCTASKAASSLGSAGMIFSVYGVRDPSRSSASLIVSWREVATVLLTSALKSALWAVAVLIAARAVGVVAQRDRRPRSPAMSFCRRVISWLTRSSSDSIPS